MEENRDFSKDRDGDEAKNVADVEDGVDQEIERVRLESFENVKRPKRRRVRIPKKTVAKTPKKIEQKEDIRESAGEIVPVGKKPYMKTRTRLGMRLRKMMRRRWQSAVTAYETEV